MAAIALTCPPMFDQSRERLHGLDHLKSLAILLVLVFYYRAYYGIPAALSPFGVNTIAACLIAAVAGGWALHLVVEKSFLALRVRLA